MPDKKFNPELKGNRLYKSTRRNIILPRDCGGKYYKKKISLSYGNKEKKKTIFQKVFFSNFHSQFTFFPLYDTDNNSYIRLYRLHSKYKNKYKNISNKTITPTQFGKCIRKINECMFKLMLREQEEIRIRKDVMFIFRKKEDNTITTLQSPLRIFWSIASPFAPKDSNMDKHLFPKVKLLVGRPLFKDLKVLAHELHTTGLLQTIPYFTGTEYAKRNPSVNGEIQSVSNFIEMEEKTMDFNMFNDF